MKNPYLLWLGVIVAAVVAFVLGRSTAPSVGGPAPTVTPSTAANSLYGPDSGSSSEGESPRVRSKDRRETRHSEKPRVSIPLETVVELVKTKDLNRLTFDDLDGHLSKVLTLLGATEKETKDVIDVFDASTEEILAAEKRHSRVAETSPEKIQIDLGGMREPVAAVIEKTQQGIRQSLPPRIAEGLISAVHWDHYYRASEPRSFEITRDLNGRLTAWDRLGSYGSGGSVDQTKFPDDGTPIPADQIFGERWKPLLRGLNLLPVDEK